MQILLETGLRLITFVKCLILRISKLQIQIDLSATNAKYIELSRSLREALPLNELIEETRHKKVIDIPKEAKVFKKKFWGIEKPQHPT